MPVSPLGLRSSHQAVRTRFLNLFCQLPNPEIKPLKAHISPTGPEGKFFFRDFLSRKTAGIDCSHLKSLDLEVCKITRDVCRKNVLSGPTPGMLQAAQYGQVLLDHARAQKVATLYGLEVALGIAGCIFIIPLIFVIHGGFRLWQIDQKIQKRTQEIKSALQCALEQEALVAKAAKAAKANKGTKERPSKPDNWAWPDAQRYQAMFKSSAGAPRRLSIVSEEGENEDLSGN